MVEFQIMNLELAGGRVVSIPRTDHYQMELGILRVMSSMSAASAVTLNVHVSVTGTSAHMTRPFPKSNRTRGCPPLQLLNCQQGRQHHHSHDQTCKEPHE